MITKILRIIVIAGAIILPITRPPHLSIYEAVAMFGVIFVGIFAAYDWVNEFIDYRTGLALRYWQNIVIKKGLTVDKEPRR